MGRIYFLLVRIKIKHMELSIIRRETTGAPPNQYNESETITKFEIMDGAPVRGAPLPLPPSMRRQLGCTDAGGRGDDPDTAVPGRVRAHADLPRGEQEVQRTVLPQPCPHRRGEPAVLQTAGLSPSHVPLNLR